MSPIAWIGLGHMGHPMSQHMRKAGYVVRGVDIDPAAAKRARRDGIEVVDTVAEACKGVDAVFHASPTLIALVRKSRSCTRLWPMNSREIAALIRKTS